MLGNNCLFFSIICMEPDVVAHIFNNRSSAEFEGQPGLHSEILSLKREEGREGRKKERRKVK